MSSHSEHQSPLQKLFSSWSWKNGYMISSAFRALDLLILFNHAWFFHGSGMATGPLVSALVGVAALFIAIMLSAGYLDYRANQHLKIAADRVSELLKKTDVTAKDFGPSKHRGLRAVPFAAIALVVIAASSINVSHILMGWSHASAYLQGMFTVISAIIILFLLFCLIKKLQFTSKTTDERSARRQQVYLLRSATENWLHLLDRELSYTSVNNEPTDRSLMNYRSTISALNTTQNNQELMKSVYAANRHHLDKLSRDPERSPIEVCLWRRLWHYGVLPIWDLLTAGTATLWVIDFAAQSLLHTPEFLTLSAAPWIIAVEILLALMITVPYMISCHLDTKEDLSINYVPTEQMNSLALCLEVYHQLHPNQADASPATAQEDPLTTQRLSGRVEVTARSPDKTAEGGQQATTGYNGPPGALPGVPLPDVADTQPTRTNSVAEKPQSTAARSFGV